MSESGGTNIANTKLADGSRGMPFLKHFDMSKLVLRGVKIFHIRSAVLKKTGDREGLCGRLDRWAFHVIRHLTFHFIASTRRERS